MAFDFMKRHASREFRAQLQNIYDTVFGGGGGGGGLPETPLAVEHGGTGVATLKDVKKSFGITAVEESLTKSTETIITDDKFEVSAVGGNGHTIVLNQAKVLVTQYLGLTILQVYLMMQPDQCTDCTLTIHDLPKPAGAGEAGSGGANGALATGVPEHGYAQQSISGTASVHGDGRLLLQVHFENPTGDDVLLQGQVVYITEQPED